MIDKSQLNNMSRKELEQLRKDVEQAMASREKVERQEALDSARRAAAEAGFTLEELVGAVKPAKRTKSNRPAKFRDPKDPTNTWSGRGRRPHWMQERLDEGMSEEQLTV